MSTGGKTAIRGQLWRSYGQPPYTTYLTTGYGKGRPAVAVVQTSVWNTKQQVFKSVEVLPGAFLDGVKEVLTDSIDISPVKVYVNIDLHHAIRNSLCGLHCRNHNTAKFHKESFGGDRMHHYVLTCPVPAGRIFSLP